MYRNQSGSEEPWGFAMGTKWKTHHSTKHLETTVTRPYKRSNTGAYYATNIVSVIPNTSQETFIVKKLTFSSKEPGLAMWNESTDKYTIIIDKVEFSAGKTKKAFKICFSNSSTFYAGKTFFNIGSYSMPSSEDNLRHQKEEVARQFTLMSVIPRFIEAAKEREVAIHDLQFAKAFILQACDGLEKRSWLVDPLLDHQKMRKFSGSDTAGINTDFAGMTCDSFAHFALADSGSQFVPADIQGIDTEVFRGDVRCANTIMLFDSMAHSKSQTMGLGDQGLAGIALFCDQHKCNSMCKKLALPSTAELLQDTKNPDDLGMDATRAPHSKESDKATQGSQSSQNAAEAGSKEPEVEGSNDTN